MNSNDKEIAKELTLAAITKISVASGPDRNQRIADEIAKVYKTLYKAGRDADKD